MRLVLSSQAKAPIICGAIFLACVSVVIYSRLSPPVADDVATAQLGAFAVEILEHPVSATAYHICNEHDLCYQSLLRTHATTLSGFPAASPPVAAPSSTTLAVDRYLFNGDNYVGSNTAAFFPNVALRYRGSGQGFVDLLISPRDRSIRASSYASPQSDPMIAWLTNVDPSLITLLERAVSSHSS